MGMKEKKDYFLILIPRLHYNAARKVVFSLGNGCKIARSMNFMQKVSLVWSY
jgi:hypothetical protein